MLVIDIIMIRDLINNVQQASRQSEQITFHLAGHATVVRHRLL
jgi:hypothetical protein